MRTILCSRHFPSGHPKWGEDTNFVEQILNSLYPGEGADLLRRLPPELPVNDFYILDGGRKKFHTIRPNNRWKPGDMASLRVWSGRPYHSKQIEFAQVEIKKTWPFEITRDGYLLNGKELGYDQLKVLAENDGLTIDDFESWFAIKPKGGGLFKGQVIAWSDKIVYP